MTESYERRQRGQDVKSRASRPNSMYSYCRVVGCGKPARAGTSDGLDTRFCRSHAEWYQRHGSPYKTSYKAKELNPYRQAALLWIMYNPDNVWVKNSIQRVLGLYRSAGPHVEAFRLTGKLPRERAKAHWARLREHSVDPRLPLAVWLAVEMVILDDPQAVKTDEYKQVQAAKVVHRMASGTHKRWDQQRRGGRTRVVELHVYPRSRGRVLRYIGEDLEGAVELLADHHLEDVRAFKLERDKLGVFTGSPYPKGWSA